MLEEITSFFFSEMITLITRIILITLRLMQLSLIRSLKSRSRSRSRG